MKALNKVYLILLIFLVVMILVNLSFGSVFISFSELFEVLTSNTSSTSEIIVFKHRLPKTITAISVGSGLSVAGLLMQSIFRNVLAGPFVLGISNGASLGVAILMMFPVVVGVSFVPQFSIVVASILGAVLVFGLVMSMSFFLNDNLSLLIVGIMIGSVAGAFVTVLQYFSSSEIIQSYLVWTFGSLSGLSWADVWVLSSVVFLGLVGSFLLSKPLNAMLLGEMYAKGVGVSVVKSKRIIVLLTCLLSGTITAFCGPIAFIGLAVPHLARLLCKTSNHNVLLPVTMLIGAILVLLCDTIAQLPASQTVLPLNAVTAFFGAPVVVWIVISGRKFNQV